MKDKMSMTLKATQQISRYAFHAVLKRYFNIIHDVYNYSQTL
jgi:hypothetical protein